MSSHAARRFAIPAIVGFLCAFVPSHRLAAADELRPGSRLEREISGARVDTFDLSLKPGECARVTVEQRGIDVAVRVADANGTVLTETDLESRPVGVEQAIVVSDAGGSHRVSVKPKYARANTGAYAITLSDIHPADEKERTVFEAMKACTEAVSFRDKGKIEQSREAALRAVELSEKALGPNDAHVATALIALGSAEGILAHYPAAREAFTRAATISEASLGHDDPQTAQALEFRGNAYVRENDFANAEASLRDAKARFQASLGHDHPRLATCLMDLGVLYLYLDPEKAAAELEPALRIADRWLDRGEFLPTAIANNLGTAYRLLHEYDRAEPLLQRALNGFAALRGPDHPLVAYPLRDLGMIARERGDFESALAYLWRAETIREKALGVQHPDTVDTMNLIGEVLSAQGRYADALDIFTGNLRSFESSLGPYNERTLSSVADLAATYAAEGNLACAIEYQKRADAIIDKDLELNLAIGSERQKLAYAEEMASSTDRTISLHVNRAPNDTAAAELALLVILQRKGRVLDAMAQNLATIRAGLTAGDQRLLDRYRTTTAELANAALNGPGRTSPAAYLAKLKELGQQRESMEEQIGAHSAAFRAQVRPASVAAVRAALPPSSALIEFALYRPYDPTVGFSKAYGKPRYVAYVLRNHGAIRWKDLGDASTIDAALARWRSALRNPGRSDVDALARAVDRRVMEPVRRLTGGVRQLLISPDGQLGLAPFEALVDRDGRYLVERVSIAYLTSGRDLLRLREARQRSKTVPVIVADPFFGEPTIERPKTQIASAGAALRSISAGDDVSTVYFAPLAGTREEANSIRALFPDARILTGKGATKSALEHLDAPEILHIATHGFFLGTGDARSDAVMTSSTRSVSANARIANPLLRSGLALTGANLSSGDDGVLTALEASMLNLWGTKLVTLSACDSGIGEVKNGEGVYGLRRAFTLAGAETVVMSLWQVSDYAARQVMTAYYSGLRRGLGRGEALRRAQLSMMSRKGRHHPFYWASFIQSGDWTPLERGR